MPEPRLRSAVRALIVDEHERILLCRFDGPDAVVWAAPGGGIEPGESPLEALRRELDEEVGLALEGAPPHVWHRRIVAPGHRQSYDGGIDDYYLVRTQAFTPRGTHSEEKLAAENVVDFRWWTLAELCSYDGGAVLAPRALAELMQRLLRDGAPSAPLAIGL